MSDWIKLGVCYVNLSQVALAFEHPTEVEIVFSNGNRLKYPMSKLGYGQVVLNALDRRVGPILVREEGGKGKDVP